MQRWPLGGCAHYYPMRASLAALHSVKPISPHDGARKHAIIRHIGACSAVREIFDFVHSARLRIVEYCGNGLNGQHSQHVQMHRTCYTLNKSKPLAAGTTVERTVPSGQVYVVFMHARYTPLLNLRGLKSDPPTCARSCCTEKI